MARSSKGLAIHLESEVFLSKETKNGEPPCRNLCDLIVYDNKNTITKLEDLPIKGPFTAVATANDALDTKSQYLGSTVIISPIMEYSMEYPFGKEAIVWLRSNQAFYRVVSVSSQYTALWNPLKTVLDLSGHVINTLIRSNSELLTPYVLKKVADMSKLSIIETIEKITNGRIFIIDQIKNQHIPKLLKSQFFKDLANLKTWLQFRTTMLSETYEQPSGASKSTQPAKISAQPARMSVSPDPPMIAISLTKKTKKTIQIAPTKTIPAKSQKSSETAEKKPKRIAESSSDSDTPIFKLKKKIGPRKGIKLRCPQATSSAVKSSEKELSDLSTHLLYLDLPNENEYEYECPICHLKLRKTSILSRILPRIQHHIHSHTAHSALDSPDKEALLSNPLSKRVSKFIDLVEKRRLSIDNRLPILSFSSRISPNKEQLNLESEEVAPKDEVASKDKVMPKETEVKEKAGKFNEEPRKKPSTEKEIRSATTLPVIQTKHAPAPTTKPPHADTQVPFKSDTVNSTARPSGSKSVLALKPAPFPQSRPSEGKPALAPHPPPQSTAILLPRQTLTSPKMPVARSAISPKKRPAASSISGSSSIDLTLKSPKQFNQRNDPPGKIDVNLCDDSDDDAAISRTLNRIPDVRVDSCWKCGFRVLGRVCNQCGSVQ